VTDARPVQLVWAIRLGIGAAAVSLGFGLVLPCMSTQTHFGEYQSWIRLLRPNLEQTRQYSVLSGILAMLRHEGMAIGLLLLFFSAIFPTAKLAVMAYATHALARGQRAGWLLAAAHHTGKFSMLDVLVLALIVIAIKGLGPNTEVRLQIGVGLFAGSVLASLVVSILLSRLEARLTAK